MSNKSTSSKWFKQLLTCASAAVLLTAGSANMAEASYRSSTVSDWKTGPIKVSGANAAQYCSMKAGFDNGTTLVWARDAARQNSLAIDFDEAALQRGQDYYVALDVKGGEYREYLAKAASDRVLIMQLGNDDAFFASLHRKNTLNIDMDGVSLSYSLKGSSAALTDLNECVAKISGDDMFETAKAGAVKFTPKTPKKETAIDNTENQELRAKLARLKAEKEALEAAQSKLIAEKDALAAAQAKAAMEAEKAAAAIAQAEAKAQKMAEQEAEVEIVVDVAQAEVALETNIETETEIVATTETVEGEIALSPVAENALEDAVVDVAETTVETAPEVTAEERKVQATIEKSREIAALVRQIETLRLEKEALSAKQTETETKLAGLDQANADQTALLAEVENLRAANEALKTEAEAFAEVKEENAALSVALSEKDKELTALAEQVAEVNLEGREISVLKSELETLRTKLAVFENAKPAAKECSVAKLPMQPDLKSDALKDVILSAELATDADLKEHKDVQRPSFSWKTGAVSGHAEQYEWPIHKDFKSMAEEYVAREKSACDGAFSRVFGKTDLVSGLQVMEAELTCVTENGPYASVLFFYGGNSQFTILEQEAEAKEMRTAIENRKRIFNAVLPNVTN